MTTARTLCPCGHSKSQHHSGKCETHTIHCYHHHLPAPGNPGAVVMRCCACLRAIIVPIEHALDYAPELHALAGPVQGDIFAAAEATS